ncbi:GDP-fucose protein O-fucosyltransferase [Cinnamomum micranthum f. kanehirae]|uniref:O-fucosyltransferase family protein n=1 Tax=Cinnamomum micranthum f. kanehirae TaxID=337451 RepID=A0A3S3MWU6_9MAGN|nr:GDP-fucose protein O-fucosyltransferase [Cinnamomum micranthum f. kanehirae]
MAVDPKQVLGAFLTLTMFVMLGRMIKRDHFDPVEVSIPETSDFSFDEMKVEEKGAATLSRLSKGPWKEDDQILKPCWTRPKSKGADELKGFVTFSLSGGPEYHISQVADAVVIAKYLGATLVIPDIRGSNPGDERSFREVYDVEKFVKSLDGIVNVAREQPAEITSKKPAIVRVPNRVTEDYIAEHIEPRFTKIGILRLATFFPSVNMRIRETQKEMDSVACLAMYATLELQPEIHEVVDSMIERLRTLSRRSEGRFVAVDLRVDILQKKGCKVGGSAASKNCYSAQEIGVFLRKIGFGKDTTVYLTQSRWDESLNALKDLFPKTYTKEDILPFDKKDKFLDSGNSELEKTLDFYICSQSDVFVPAISGLFYANVAGKRIASGRNQILVPAQISGPSASAPDFISHYVSKKNHLAYSCFC